MAATGQLVDVSLIEPWPGWSNRPRWPTTSSDRSRAGPATGSTPARPATPTAPRDDRWVAISSASSSVAARVYRAIDRPDLAARPEYVDPIPRQARAAEVDALVAAWVGAHPLEHAMKVFLAEDVAAAPIYDAQQLLADEHLRARGTFVDGRRSRPGRDDRAGSRRPVERDARRHRPPWTSPRRRQRRRVP